MVHVKAKRPLIHSIVSTLALSATLLLLQSCTAGLNGVGGVGSDGMIPTSGMIGPGAPNNPNPPPNYGAASYTYNNAGTCNSQPGIVNAISVSTDYQQATMTVQNCTTLTTPIALDATDVKFSGDDSTLTYGGVVYQLSN